MKSTKREDPFGPQLAASLEPRLQDALGHPLRREIVRALNTSKQPRGIDELDAALAPASVAEVSYHVQVLHRGGVIEGEGPESPAAGRYRTYKSLVAGDAEVLAVLVATEQWDQDQRKKASGHSPTFLSMFRIPRPTRTIRLGSHRKPRPEPGA